MPWAEQRCKQHLGLKIIQPPKSIWVEQNIREQMPTPVFRLMSCVAEDSQTKNNIPVLSVHNLII